jgi:hypothetical protein
MSPATPRLFRRPPWASRGTGTASGFLPIVITTRLRVELDDHVRPFIDDPDVVLRSTRTVWANINPYAPCPISRTKFPAGLNSNSRALAMRKDSRAA